MTSGMVKIIKDGRVIRRISENDPEYDNIVQMAEEIGAEIHRESGGFDATAKGGLN